MFNGNKLRQLRTNFGIKQSELSKKLGVSTSTVGMWEQCRSTPPDDVIVKLSSIFDVSTDYLLDNDEISKVAENQDDTQEIVERIKLMKYNELEKQLFKETGNLTDEQKRVILATVRAMNKEIIKEIDKEDNAS